MLNLDILYKILKERIIKRTKSGYDVLNQPFKPYTKEYAKKKKSNKVDLTLTGHMLNSLGISPLGLSVLNGFARDKQRYNLNNDRIFFGTNALDISALLTLIYKQTLQYVRITFNGI